MLKTAPFPCALPESRSDACPPVVRWILRPVDVAERIGCSVSYLYAMVRDGSFPKPVALTDDRAAGFISDEIAGWIASVNRTQPARFAGPAPACSDRILKLGMVAQVTRLSPAWIEQAIRRCRFPAPVQLVEAARGWVLSDIMTWIGASMAARARGPFGRDKLPAPVEIAPRGLLRGEIEEITRLSGSQIYALIAARRFPAGKRGHVDGKRGVYWPSSEVDRWIARIRAERKAGP
jgi:predicted DNA-binding transcriptional regulator AlpA